jgi:hypothetical protein
LLASANATAERTWQALWLTVIESLLTNDRTLASLDPHTGQDLTRSGINLLYEPATPYAVHLVYTSHRYIVFERTNPGVPETTDDNSYYFTNRPALIAVG